MVKDRGVVNPARFQKGLSNGEGEVGVPDAKGGSSVGALVTIHTRVALHPRELEQGVVASEHTEEVLEQGTERARGSKLEKGEVRPTVPLHGKEASSDETKDEGRVGVDVKVGGLPGLQGHDDRGDLGHVIGYHRSNYSGIGKDTGVGEPTGTCYAGLEAVVYSGPIGPNSNDRGMVKGGSRLGRDRRGAEERGKHRGSLPGVMPYTVDTRPGIKNGGGLGQNASTTISTRH